MEPEQNEFNETEDNQNINQRNFFPVYKIAIGGLLISASLTFILLSLLQSHKTETQSVTNDVVTETPETNNSTIEKTVKKESVEVTSVPEDKILSDTFSIKNSQVHFHYDLGWEPNSIHVELADPASFKPVSGRYGKDKNYVFFETRVLEGADPKLFKVEEYPYGTDGNKVWNGASLINEASPEDINSCWKLYGVQYSKEVLATSSDNKVLVVGKENASDCESLDVYIQSVVDGSQTFFRTIRNARQSHRWGGIKTDWVENNLFITRWTVDPIPDCSGCIDIKPTLWRYKSGYDEGELIYEFNDDWGGFSVSPDKTFVAVYDRLGPPTDCPTKPNYGLVGTSQVVYIINTNDMSKQEYSACDLISDDLQKPPTAYIYSADDLYMLANGWSEKEYLLTGTLKRRFGVGDPPIYVGENVWFVDPLTQQIKYGSTTLEVDPETGSLLKPIEEYLKDYRIGP